MNYKKEIDLGLLKRLAEVNCTQKEMAHVLQVGLRTLERRLAEDPELREMVDRVIALERWEVRKEIARISKDPDHPKQMTALIFRAKTELGLSEYGPRVDSDEAEVATQADAELEERIKRWVDRNLPQAAREPQRTH